MGREAREEKAGKGGGEGRLKGEEGEEKIK